MAASINYSDWSSAIGKKLPIPGIEEVIETHLSLVVLARERVYKFKKPLLLSFVDYSSFRKRWISATQEVLLNRRLTKDVYYGIRAVSYVSGKWKWVGELYEEPSIENIPKHHPNDNVAVVMRRLDSRDFLNELLKQGSVDFNEHLKPLVKVIAEFHTTGSLREIEPDKYQLSLEENLEDNIKALDDLNSLPNFSHLIKRATRFYRQNYPKLRRLIYQRAKEGWVVEGHGDLRLEHVCYDRTFTPPFIQIFDCVEFNSKIRQSDACCEIAFLLMELEANYRTDLAKAVEQEYLCRMQDKDFEKILPLFKHYRALVRAKVNYFRASQLPTTSKEHSACLVQVKKLLSLASRYAFAKIDPLIIIVCGLMGTGKSTLANLLSEHLYAIHLNSDLTRKEIFQDLEAEDSSEAPYQQGIYSLEATDATYRAIVHQASIYLGYGNPVILDATFSKHSHRRLALELAHSKKVPLYIVECLLNRDETLNRLAVRSAQGQSISDGRPELYDNQVASWEKIDDSEGDDLLRIDMSTAPEVSCQKILAEFFIG
ncbi:MAG: AAA family ATPase [Bdellovibrionales bacterium]|nr:AAA family ATPase [Bdellovibrionales bacterium]